MTTTETADLDPLHLSMLVPNKVLRDFGSDRYSIRVRSGESACDALAPNGKDTCTRPKNHPPHWRHVSTSDTRIVDIWFTDCPDPLPAPTIGAVHTRTHEGHGWVVEAARCTFPLDGVSCTRHADHPESWPHVAVVNNVVAAHSLQEKDESDPGFDAPDGTPEDPAQLVFTTRPEVGTLVRLRDHSNLLYVMRHCRGGELTELYDLTKHDGRHLPVDRLVIHDVAPTVEQASEAIAWFSKMRQTTRDIAIREHRGGRWCSSGLQQNLQHLGLEEFVPDLMGEIRVTVPFIVGPEEDSDRKRSAIQAAIRAVLSRESLQEALPLDKVEGIKLQPDRMEIGAYNFRRS